MAVVLKNLQTNFFYRVNLIGIDSSTSLKVQKVTTPEALTVTERTHFERGHKVRLAGTTANDDTLTLESIIPNTFADLEFMRFSEELREVGTGRRTLPQIHFKTITVQELNEVGTPIRNLIFKDCILNKYELPDFDSTSSENAIEKLVFYVNEVDVRGSIQNAANVAGAAITGIFGG